MAIHNELKVKRKFVYYVWSSMIKRCYNPKDKCYSMYGGRGISVCSNWRYSYLSFSNWAKSSGYIFGLQLDRKDNNKGYSPKNCRWVTPKINARNRRSNTLITYKKETKCIAAWADDPRCLVSRGTFAKRIRLGWTTYRALTTPLITKYSHKHF